jgi:hypothetical protein
MGRSSRSTTEAQFRNLNAGTEENPEKPGQSLLRTEISNKHLQNTSSENCSLDQPLQCNPRKLASHSTSIPRSKSFELHTKCLFLTFEIAYLCQRNESSELHASVHILRYVLHNLHGFYSNP